LNNAYCVVVAHNHPAGSTDPSPEDLDTTRQLIAAGKLLGIEILDHLIVSFMGVASIRESHPQVF
jgi:DNA repair protein RadC